VWYARGAAAAVRLLAVEENSTPAELLDALSKDRDGIQAAQIRQLISSDLVGDRHYLEENAL
jgi:hypothetical protein